MKQKIIASLAVMIIGLVGIFFIVKTQNKVKIVSECPAQQVVEQVVEERVVYMPSGWKCDEPKIGKDDVLQPSGVWAIDNITCLKLIKPISVWCAENPKATCTDEQKKSN